MRRRISVALLLAALPVFASIVDRVAITVGNKVITESAITQRILLAAFQNGVAPDFSDASRRQAAQRLIDQKLTEREMDVGNYPRISIDESKELLDAFTTEHYHANAGQLRLALASASLTTAELQAELAAQADLLAFLSLRFRPAVQVSDQDIEAYFQEHIAAEKAANPKALSEVRAGIEQIIANQRADSDLEKWLQDQRTRTKIIYHAKELQ